MRVNLHFKKSNNTRLARVLSLVLKSKSNQISTAFEVKPAFPFGQIIERGA